MTSKHIALVLDSGIGGLSIVKKIRSRTPELQIIYLADTAAFPYGTKSPIEMQQRITTIIESANKLYQPDIAIIACNSASTAVLTSLRETFNIPFVGVVPAIKPAAKTSQTKTIGVLATAHTANSEYTKGLIQEYANDCEVLLFGSSHLAQLAEEKYRGQSPNNDEIGREISKLTSQPSLSSMDTIVLACTHYPLLLNELKLWAPQIEHWIDSSDAIANRVQNLLKTIKNKGTARHCKGSNIFLSTKEHKIYSKKLVVDALGSHQYQYLNLPK